MSLGDLLLRLVDQFSQYPDKAVRFHRLAEVSVHPRLHRKLDVLVEGVGGKGDYRDAPGIFQSISTML